MPNPLTISDASNMIDLRIQKVFLKTTTLKEENYKKYFHVETVTDYEYRDSSLSAHGLADRVVENAAITGQSPVAGNTRLYTQVNNRPLMSVMTCA